MEYLIDTKSKRIATWLDALMPSMLAQLKLSKRAGFVLVTVSKQDNEGLAQELFAGSFVVSLKKGMTLEKFGLSLAHELVHVKQFVTGKLSDTKHGARVWNGVKYHKKTPYMDQPWELQAFANQEILFRRALET